MNKIEVENKIKDLKDQMKHKLLERGEAIREGGGWHDNAAVDSINTEIYVLESRIRELNQELIKFED
jgi:hypothetical protein